MEQAPLKSDSPKHELSHPASWHPAVIARRCAFALLVTFAILCVRSAEAQVMFRSPGIPTGQTVGGEMIDQGQFQSGVSSGPIVLQKPTATFLPPANPDSSLNANGLESRFESGLEQAFDDETESDIPQLGNFEDGLEEVYPEEDSTDRSTRRLETIRQRYPDGKTRLLRQVAQDAAGNYFNHGAWRVLSKAGDVVAEGQFDRGRMSGQWRRYHSAGAGGLFSTSPFNKFKGRFLSVASFDDGQLDGMWTIYDQNNQKIFEVPYKQGQRDGAATWWYPTATKMREATFSDGVLDGKILEWDDQGKLTRREEFISGQRVVRNVSLYRPNAPREEQFYLDGKMKLDGQDQWWEAQPAAYSASGTRVQHGPIKRWYENGQPKMQGQYRDDERVGKFTWWHSNGGRKLVATYEKGQKEEIWTWWHDNGMRSIQGEYKADEAVGVWTWWDENGQVTKQEDFDKVNRSKSESSGELTEPDNSSEDDDSNSETEEPQSLLEPAADDTAAEATPKAADTIPLLLDTDALEQIDPLEDTPGELPQGLFFREPEIKSESDDGESE